MKKGFILSTLALVFIAFSSIAVAQTANEVILNSAKKYPLEQVRKVGTVNLSETAPDPWEPMLYNTETIHEQGDQDREAYKKHKAELNARKKEMQEAWEGPSYKMTGTAAVDAPIQGTNFFGNTHDGVPNDNAIAVSREGMVVSATNSKVQIYDENGIPKLTRSLSAFIGMSGQKFDPKVTYDPHYDRFILLFLNGNNSAESNMIVCFTETNDPTGNWNVYAVNGNPDPGTYGPVWTDFCQIGISNDEFFFAGNLFGNNSGSPGSMVWQVDKKAGYNGDATLPVQKYGSTNNNTFAMCPAEGSKFPYGPKFFLVSTFTSPFVGAASVYLHEITDTIGGNPQFNTYLLTSNQTYALSPDGSQKDSQKKLDVRDCRVRSAYFENDRIQFGMNVNAGGNSGIYYGTISGLANPSFAGATGQIIRIDSFDISFPGLAYGGQVSQNGDNASVLFFNFASTDHYPGNGVLMIDTLGQLSDPTILKYGFTYIDMNDDPVRWGDYTTADWRHLYDGEIWAAGYLGYNSNSNLHGTWISQIFLPGLPAVNRDEDIKIEPLDASVYPNPAPEIFHVDFDVPETGKYSVGLVDLEGREIENLIGHNLARGKAHFSFHTEHLAPGTYFVRIQKDNQLVESHKVVVVR